MEKKQIVEAEDVKGVKVYELGYLLLSTIAEEQVAIVVGNIKSMIEAAGGVHISDAHPKQMALAYDMIKVINHKKELFSQAYFGWMKFEVEALALAKIKTNLDQMPEVIRFLLIKTVRENTLASRRAFPRGEFAKRKPASSAGEPEIPVEMNKEEVDKKIDEMATAV